MIIISRYQGVLDKHNKSREDLSKVMTKIRQFDNKIKELENKVYQYEKAKRNEMSQAQTSNENFLLTQLRNFELELEETNQKRTDLLESRQDLIKQYREWEQKRDELQKEKGEIAKKIDQCNSEANTNRAKRKRLFDEMAQQKEAVKEKETRRDELRRKLDTLEK